MESPSRPQPTLPKGFLCTTHGQRSSGVMPRGDTGLVELSPQSFLYLYSIIPNMTCTLSKQNFKSSEQHHRSQSIVVTLYSLTTVHLVRITFIHHKVRKDAS